MKPTTFIEFYRSNGAGYVEVLGSDGVAYLDGRWGIVRQHREAATIGHKRGFDGYKICHGTHTNHVERTPHVQIILPCNVNR